MKIKNFAALAALSLFLGAGGLSADEGEEILTAHPMPVYPKSVTAKSGDELARLTKDDLSAVRKYFEKNLKPGDRIEDFKKDGEEGFEIVYTKKSGKRELKAFELRVSRLTEKRPPHQAFGELNAQVSAGRHGKAELDAILKEYAPIDSAYFRALDGGKGTEADEILALAHKEAHPDDAKLKAAGRKNKVSDEDKAEAKELKKKMKEMKAKGDFAGMMALAQSSKKFQAPPANQAEAMKMAMDDKNRDTWDIWIKCLKDTKAAAYNTRIEYSADALKK